MIASRYRWPGPVHEGGGVAQGVIDIRADDLQRDAIIKILSGEEQEPTTVFNIYGSTIESELDTLFTSIEFDCDFDRRTGFFKVPGAMEMTLEPIRNPVTGAHHHAQIRLPNGFEFREAEMASGRFNGSGGLAFDNRDCYGFLSYVAYGPYGVVD